MPLATLVNQFCQIEYVSSDSDLNAVPQPCCGGLVSQIGSVVLMICLALSESYERRAERATA